MEAVVWIVGIALFALFLYRRVLPKFLGPRIIVRGLLRRYHLFERTGLPEKESLFKVLASRSGWRNLPSPFLVELIARLETKENVFRFVSLAEGYEYNRKELPGIARNADLDGAMRQIAAWLGDFGHKLHNENRLKEAEFVQKLALELLPDQSSTMLPLAATYYKMERFADAVPLFKKGLARIETSANGADSFDSSSANNPAASTSTYEEMYAECLKAAKNQPEAS